MATLIGLVAVLSCGTLPDLSAGCGNSIVEEGEDCDSHPNPTSRAICGKPGTPAQCRLDCSQVAGADTTKPLCPTGFRCGSDAICRAASGGFKDGVSISSLANGVTVADFDGDGVNDILARSRVDLTVYYGNFARKFGTGFTIPAADVNPAAGILTGDPGSLAKPGLPGDSTLGKAPIPADVAYAISNIGGPITLWQGQSDHTLVSTPYPSLTFAAGGDLAQQPRIIPLGATRPNPPDEVVVFVPRGPIGSGIFLTADASGNLTLLFPLPYVPADIVSLEKGQLREDPVTSPCDEFVVAVKGESAVHVYTPCNGEALNGLLSPPPAGRIEPLQVQLASGAIDTGLHLVDLDGDGHLDLLVDAATDVLHKTVQVAFGRGDGTFSSVAGGPADNKTAESTVVPAYPLAIANLTNDALVDYVFPRKIVLVTGGGDGGADAGVPRSREVSAPRGVTWNDAHVLDLNGDGLLDVVTGSASASIDVYINGSSGLFNHSSYAAEGPTSNFVFGDFDGDHNVDVAFAAGGVTSDTLSIMFGQNLAPPQAPVRITHFDRIEQIGSGLLQTGSGTPDGVSDLGVVWRTRDANTQNVSILQGSTDRQIQAPFALAVSKCNVDSDCRSGQKGSCRNNQCLGGIGGATALGLAIGRFTVDANGQAIEPRHADIAAVGVDVAVAPEGSTATIRFWRSQMINTGELGQLTPRLPPPMTVSADPSPEIYALDTKGKSPIHDWSRVQLAAFDVDGPSGSAIDALAVLAPASPRSVSATGGPPIEGDGTLYVEHVVNGVFVDLAAPISLGPDRADAKRGVWQLGSVDLNNDLANEIVVFVDGKVPQVQVYWNRLNGKFDGKPVIVGLPLELPACARASMSECNRPIGFAALNADRDPQQELFILTAEHVFSAKNVPGTDDFQMTQVPVIEITPGFEPTSIAAGDVDGDGIDDVIVTSPRELRVFFGDCAGVNCETRVVR